MEKPSDTEVKITVMTESFSENSLPYRVYTNKTIKEIIPITRHNHAKIQRGIEGT